MKNYDIINPEIRIFFFFEIFVAIYWFFKK